MCSFVVRIGHNLILELLFLADQNQVHSHVTTTTVDSERALINKWTSSSDDDQDGDQDGRHQNTKQQDRVERNGKMVFRESEIQPKPLKKNVSISNMVEEYGFGRSFESVDFDELFANSGRYRPKLSEIAGYVGKLWLAFKCAHRSIFMNSYNDYGKRIFIDSWLNGKYFRDNGIKGF